MRPLGHIEQLTQIKLLFLNRGWNGKVLYESMSVANGLGTSTHRQI